MSDDLYPLTADKSARSDEQPSSIVLLNTGDGKGKSSSAFGVMGRAWARGWRIGVVQFIKGGDWKTGEQKLGEHLGVDWLTMGDGFTWDVDDIETSKQKAAEAWDTAAVMLLSGDYQLVILDEITYPLAWGWIDSEKVGAAVRDRSPVTNVILTGRDASAQLVDVADTVTDMRNVKHAFDAGIVAKKGIEY